MSQVYSLQSIKREGNLFIKLQTIVFITTTKMNSRYAQMLKTLKVAYPQEMPPYEQQMAQLVKDDLKPLAEQIGTIQKQINRLQTQLSPITSTQIINLPQNIAKRDLLNFSKTKMAIVLDQYYRIKRFLLVYNNTRLNKIENQYWHYSGNLRQEVKTHLSEAEKLYFNDYKLIATEYMEAVGLELTLDLDPPIDASVEVRFLKNCGEILSDEGDSIKLEKNSVLYIKKRLIQNFIKDGSAEIISSNTH